MAGLAFAFAVAWLFAASSAAAFAASSVGLELAVDTSVVEAFAAEACACLAQERRNRFVENSFVAAGS